MKKMFAILGIIAGAFMLVGGVLVGIGFAMGVRKNIDLFDGVINLSYGRGELVKQDYRELEEFDSMYIDMDRGSVEIVPSDKYGIEYELYSDSVSCEVNNGKLTFKESEHRFTFGFDLSWIGGSKAGVLKVYVPENKLNDVEIYLDMGNVTVADMTCRKLTLDCDMGNIYGKNVTAEIVYIDADMGNVEFDGTITDRIDADIDMGSLELSGWLDCDVDIDADMGSVELMTYYSAASYQCRLDADMGSENVRDRGGIDSEKVHYMKIKCDMGNLTVTHRSPDGGAQREKAA